MASRIIHDDFGPIYIETTSQGVRRLEFADPSPLSTKSAAAEQVLEETVQQLRDYLAGRRRGFTVPLDTPQGTAFQRQVWQAALEIPYGQTRSYGDLAAQLGRPRASRAVGSALGANPIAIIVPCHRVLRSDGSLGGYAGGLDRKRALLRLEGWPG